MISREEALLILKKEGCDEKVIRHCALVSDVAVELAKKNMEMGRNVDIHLVEIGALLHDLGRAKTHSMEHGVIGARLAEKYNLEKPILEIIKKHIGAGITNEEAAYFELPDDDYIPRTWEEKIVAHADNMVKGGKRITLKKRNKLLKEFGVDKEIRDRIKALAYEIEPYLLECETDGNED